MRKLAIVCLLLVLGLLSMYGQTPISGVPMQSLNGLDTAMLQLMSNWNSPGASLAITVEGKLVFAHGYGYADTDAMEPVQPDSLFRIASITKPFTATAILKLIEQGKLQLTTTPFTSVLQDLTPPSGQTEDPRINQITIQELLNHSAGWDDTVSGVPDPPFAYVDAAAEAFGVTPPASPDILIRYMLGQPLQHDPGTVTAYSNFGYIVLGRIIERVSGQTYAHYLNSNVQVTAGILRMNLAGSLLADRAPDEVRYYDYPGAPLVGSVFPPIGTPVPTPYGGFSLELMAANGGWMASTMDLLRFVDTMNGQLTPAILQSPPSGFVGYVPPVGDGWGWNFYGSLPGTNTVLHLDTGFQVSGRVSWAILFNTRSGTDTAQPDTDADAQILAAIHSITAWPTNDLFPIYSGTTSSCAFTLSAQTRNITQMAGTGQVSVQDQNYCAWTAFSTVPWVSVTSESVNSDSGVVSYSVENNSGPARVGTISIAGQSFTIHQDGASPTVNVSPTSLTFASEPINSTSTAQTVTLTNSGQVSVDVNSIITTGDFSQTNACGAAIAGQTNCAISVTFIPTTTGTRTGTLTISDNASGSPQTVTLIGTGVAVEAVPGVTLSPTSLTFAAQNAGTTSAAQIITLTNSGQASLSVTSITASGDFAETNTCSTSIAAGATCNIAVTFTPTAGNTRSGTLTITDNASGSPHTVSLTGTGSDVTISSSSAQLSVASAGGSATTSIQISSAGNFSGAVDLTCAVKYQGAAVPTDAPACSLSPSQEQVSAGAPATATLTVTTTAASTSARLDNWLFPSGSALAALLFWGFVPRRRWRGPGLFVLLCVVAVISLVGCGGGNSTNSSGGSSAKNPGTTTGNYTVTVTATSGTVAASTSIPLSVQ